LRKTTPENVVEAFNPGNDCPFPCIVHCSTLLTVATGSRKSPGFFKLTHRRPRPYQFTAFAQVPCL
jgi:hypothetical protein